MILSYVPDFLVTTVRPKNSVAINRKGKFTLKLCYKYCLNERSKGNMESWRDIYHGNNTSEYVLMIYW